MDLAVDDVLSTNPTLSYRFAEDKDVKLIWKLRSQLRTYLSRDGHRRTKIAHDQLTRLTP